MQENKVERERNTNLKDSSFTSIVWVLELIDRTLVYGVFCLQAENEDRIEFSRKRVEHRIEEYKRQIKGGKYECSLLRVMKGKQCEEWKVRDKDAIIYTIIFKF